MRHRYQKTILIYRIKKKTKNTESKNKYLLNQKKHIRFAMKSLGIRSRVGGRSSGPLVPWSTGPLVLWSSGPLVLPPNLHSKAHKVLHLPRNLHFKVHKKVLRLPRNLHSKAHKVLRLPLATNSALQHPQSPAPATKCALQGPQSTAPATKHYDYHYDTAAISPVATLTATAIWNIFFASLNIFLMRVGYFFIDALIFFGSLTPSQCAPPWLFPANSPQVRVEQGRLVASSRKVAGASRGPVGACVG